MPYLHGGDVYGAASIEIDFSVNTTPLGVPPAVLQAVSSCREEILRYPDSQCRALRQALSEFWPRFLASDSSAGLSLPASHFICGNGAADLIFALVRALKPRKAVLFDPCFSEYEEALKAEDCSIIRVPLSPDNQWLPSLADFLECMERSGGADLVFLGNPNNPTGMALESVQTEKLLQVCSRFSAVLVVDECFNGFLDHPEQFTVAGLTKNYPNLFVLNAFTKVYGMAGLRLGYGICSDTELLERMTAVRQPWSVSGLAQKAGIAALSEESFAARARELVSRERAFLTEEMRKLGFTVYPSMVNYLLFSHPWETKPELKAFLMKRGILIRSCSDYRSLDSSFYRIAVKTRSENGRLLQELKAWKDCSQENDRVQQENGQEAEKTQQGGR